jgi:hypothetical protein
VELKDVKIIIPTCDKYIHIVEGLMYTINKFLNLKNKFIILGYKTPKFDLLKNWSFYCLGDDTGPNNWSNDLISFFNDFNDEYFINMIDDTLLTRPSDINKIYLFFNFMLKNKDIKKCFLHGSLSSGESQFGDISLSPILELDSIFYDINQTANYRSSLQSAIWSTDYFKKLLKPNMTPWDFELQHSKNDGARIITTISDHPIMISHLYRVGNQLIPEWYKSVFEPTYLPDEDIYYLKNLLKL